MYDFITDLFNIDKKMIKKIEVISSNGLTKIHISLKPESLDIRIVTHCSFT
ncbi:flagellar hook-length control protein FliK [Amedibacterium intestinale]|uniref:flagellar hook-length control protein FliK n=1 Tax=Amedibacterium intestinale TaxID=2583452 RepID=UPI0011C2327D